MALRFSATRLAQLQLIELINHLSINDLRSIEERGNNARLLAETCYTEAGQLAKFRTFFNNMRQSAK